MGYNIASYGMRFEANPTCQPESESHTSISRMACDSHLAHDRHPQIDSSLVHTFRLAMPALIEFVRTWKCKFVASPSNAVCRQMLAGMLLFFRCASFLFAVQATTGTRWHKWPRK